MADWKEMYLKEKGFRVSVANADRGKGLIPRRAEMALAMRADL